MSRTLALVTALLWLCPATAAAHSGHLQMTVAGVAHAMGADQLRSIRYAGSGTSFAVGQSPTPGAPWPRFTLKSAVRLIDYETASLREDVVRTQAEAPPRGGGLQPIRGELAQTLMLSGDRAWNLAGGAPAPAPVALAERQMQLWITPHGVVKAALAHNAVLTARAFSFDVPRRFRARATVNAQGLVERVDALVSNPVVGDMPVVVVYSGYRDYAGVKFPTRIRQSVGGFPALDLTVTDVQPNAPADIETPELVRQATDPYARVTVQPAADGVWYLMGGSHHSAVIEMKDHVIVVEAPLDEARAAAVMAEARALVPGKPIRYVVNSHHHFDHAGGLRAFAADGVTVITHEVNRLFFERTLTVLATVSPDRMSQTRRPVTVEGVRDRRVLTDGARTVEIHHVAGNQHDDGLLMVYLPAERLLIEADAFTPGPAEAPVAMPPSPFTVNLADNVARLGFAVDRVLPLHGRMVPLADLERAAGRTP